MKVAAYLRVSTDAQTVENQRPDVEAFCAARGWTLTKLFTETVSGAARRRPVFDKMLDEARRGGFEAVIVWRLDRFGRSMLANMDSVRALDAAGVGVVSVKEPWLNTAEGPLRNLLIAVFSYVAEVERAALRERTKAGLARARSQGVKLGRPKADPKLIAEAVQLVGAGVPVLRAARQTGLGEGTVRRALAVRGERSSACPT